MNELQYQDVSTYLRAWYKGKKNDSPIELGSDLGLLLVSKIFLLCDQQHRQLHAG